MIARLQIVLLVAVLMLVGLSAAAYKHIVLGFPLLANAQQDVWKVEAKVSFEANSGEATVKLNIPDPNIARRITLLKSINLMSIIMFGVKFI